MRGVKEFSQGFLAGFARAFVSDAVLYALVIVSLFGTLWMLT
jgi:hypothetical protein